MADRVRNGSAWGERVDRSQRACERERGERIVVAGCWIWFRNYLWRKKVGEDITLGLVDSLMGTLNSRISMSHKNLMQECNTCTLRKYKKAYPAPLKTVLRAEEAVNALLETSRTLQGPRTIPAIYPSAFPRFNLGRHAVKEC